MSPASLLSMGGRLSFFFHYLVVLAFSTQALAAGLALPSRKILSADSIASGGSAAGGKCAKAEKPKEFTFDAESKGAAGQCGGDEMRGYTANEEAVPSGKAFAYFHGFGGPTDEGHSGTGDWWDMDPGEKAKVTEMAKGCGMNLPQDKERWLGEDGMKCLVQEVKKLPANVVAFEIDNASHLLGQYKDQAKFVERFAKLMEEQGVCKAMVMKNLKPEEFKAVLTKVQSRGINPNLISNFAIIEKEFDLGATQAALQGSDIKALQSMDSKHYKVSSCDAKVASAASSRGNSSSSGRR